MSRKCFALTVVKTKILSLSPEPVQQGHWQYKLPLHAALLLCHSPALEGPLAGLQKVIQSQIA